MNLDLGKSQFSCAEALAKPAENICDDLNKTPAIWFFMSAFLSNATEKAVF